MPSYPGLECLTAEIAALDPVHDVGRVSEISGGQILVRKSARAAAGGCMAR